jgi:hypothetical protein
MPRFAFAPVALSLLDSPQVGPREGELMTQRLVRIATVATAFVLGAAGKPTPPPPGVERTLCEMRCEQRHHACVLLAAIINTANLDDSFGRPTRGPGNERPGKWPFTDDVVVDDPRAEPAKDPKCSLLQDRCLVNECGSKEAGQD